MCCCGQHNSVQLMILTKSGYLDSGVRKSTHGQQCDSREKANVHFDRPAIIIGLCNNNHVEYIWP